MDPILRLYAIVRGDLDMPPGKSASQAGHAFLDSYLSAPPDLQAAYRQGGGTKVILIAPDRHALEALHKAAQDRGLPCSLIIDQHHILPPHFDGRPIVTALGLGPASREQVCDLTAELTLMP